MYRDRKEWQIAATAQCHRSLMGTTPEKMPVANPFPVTCIPLRYAPTTRFPLNRVKAEKRKREKRIRTVRQTDFYLIEFEVQIKQNNTRQRFQSCK